MPAVPRDAEGGAGRGDARLCRTPSEVVCAWGAQDPSDLIWAEVRGMQVVPCMHACMRCVPLPLLDSSALVFIWRSNVPSCPNASKPYLLQNYRYTSSACRLQPPFPVLCQTVPRPRLCTRLIYTVTSVLNKQTNTHIHTYRYDSLQNLRDQGVLRYGVWSEHWGNR